MRLRIQLPRDIEEAPSLRAHVERRLGFALSRLEDRLSGVRVRCTDENGPKGGLDKRCVVELRGPDIDTLVVEARATVWNAAIDEAVERAARALVRVLDRVGRRAAPSPYAGAR
ncbi:MAG: HPF/RaiA family ribosome-associated protein [Deltaproteobacteria bacterium]|nr:HPF/RaiA family ribosome-associated protein [Deltaproteobacteria bacterium]